MADRSFSVRLAAETAAYEQAMGRAEQATRRIGDAGEKSGSLVGKAMAGGLSAVSKVTATAAAGATVLGAAVLKTGASYNTLEQQARAALTTILGSEDAANRMMQQVAEFAKTSPFPRQAFIEGTQQLLAFGMQAERIVPTLGAVQDAVAAAGGGAQQISEIVNILAQVQSSGRFTAETLNQLGYRGVDAAKLLGEAFGLSAGEMRDAISEGTYDAQTLLTTLTEQMTATYGGAAENVKNTWIGATDRIRGAFRDISSIIVEPFISKGGGGLALDWANAFADAMRGIEAQVGPLSEALVGRLAGSLDSVTDRLQGLRPAIDGFDLSGITDDLDDLIGYAPLVGAVGTALVVMGTNSIPVLSSLGLAGINPVVAGLSALVALHPGLRGLLGDFLSDLSPLLPVLRDTAAGLLDAGTAIIDALLPGLSAVLDAVAPAAVALGTTLGGSAVILAQALVPVAEAVSAVLGLLDYIPGSVTTAVLAFAAFRGINMAGVLTPLRGVTDQIALQQTLARNAGIQVGFMGGAMGAASVSAQRLGTSLKTMFLSNPIGIALAGITTAVGVWSSAQAKARQEVADSEQRVDELSASLDRNTGAYTENTRTLVYNDLARRGLLETGSELGITARTLVDAALGEAAAVAEVNRKYEAGRGLHSERVREIGHATRETRDGLRPLLDFAEGMAIVTAETALSVEEELARQEATRVGADASQNATLAWVDMALATRDYAQALREANPEIANQRAYVEEALEAYYEWIEATRESSAGFIDMSGAMQASQQASREWAEQTAAATESAEDSWEDYYDGVTVNLEKVRDELLKQVEAQANWEQNIQSLVGRVPDAYLQMLIDMGAQGAPLVQALADDHTGLTEEIGQTWEEAGQRSPQRFAENLAMQQTVVDIAARKLGEGAAAEISKAIADGEMSVAEAVAAYDLLAEVEVVAQTDPFAGAVLDEIERVEAMEIVATVMADLSNAEREATAWEARTAAMSPVPQVNAVATMATRVAEAWYKATDDLRPTPDIDATTSEADRKRDAFITSVKLANPVMAMFLNADEASREMSAFFSAYQGTRIGVNIGFGNADGAFHDRGTRYADGGIDAAGQHVPRVPMMGGPAYGKRYITWGEDVTNWEAYISGKPGMEQRNRGVLEEAARRMGLTVLDALDVPKINYANGGMHSILDLRVTERDKFRDQLEGAQAEYLSSLGGGGAGAMAWPAIWALIRSVIPGAVMTSNFRPGAVTAGYGTPSLHGQGRAVDFVSPNMAAATAMLSVLRGWTELIHTPAGMWQQQNGRRFAGFNAVTRAMHHDHVHVGAEDGGILDALLRAPKVADTGHLTLSPGWNPPTYNGLGRYEHMVDVTKMQPASQPPGPIRVSLEGGRISGTLRLPDGSLGELMDARIDMDHDTTDYQGRMVGVPVRRR